MCVHSQTCKNKCAELLVNFGTSVSRKGDEKQRFCLRGLSAVRTGSLKALVVIDTLQLCQERGRSLKCCWR